MDKFLNDSERRFNTIVKTVSDITMILNGSLNYMCDLMITLEITAKSTTSETIAEGLLYMRNKINKHILKQSEKIAEVGQMIKEDNDRE